jgi:hypothetical protein
MLSLVASSIGHVVEHSLIKKKKTGRYDGFLQRGENASSTSQKEVLLCDWAKMITGGLIIDVCGLIIDVGSERNDSLGSWQGLVARLRRQKVEVWMPVVVIAWL